MSDEKKDTRAEPLTVDRARQIILARRARFVAAALAGIGAVGCESPGQSPVPGVCLSFKGVENDAGRPPRADAGRPRVCLSVVRPDEGGPPSVDAGRPRVCLTVVPRPQDAGRSDAGDAGDAGTLRGIDAGPQVCLSVVKLRSDPGDQEAES